MVNKGVDDRKFEVVVLHGVSGTVSMGKDWNRWRTLRRGEGKKRKGGRIEKIAGKKRNE